MAPKHWRAQEPILTFCPMSPTSLLISSSNVSDEKPLKFKLLNPEFFNEKNRVMRHKETLMKWSKTDLDSETLEVEIETCMLWFDFFVCYLHGDDPI